MAVPARPTSGVPIETAWGQVAHDTAVAMDIQTGSATLTNANANAADLPIVFPRPFASTPVVFANLASNTTFNYAIAHSVTPTGCTLKTVRRDGSATSAANLVQWLAYGPRA